MIARALALAAAVLVLTSSPVQSSAPAPTAANVVRPVQVSVVDETHGQWPGLRGALVGWNASPYVHLRLADACTPGVYCTVVRAGAYGLTSWGAQTLAPSAVAVTVVRLNLSYSYAGPDWSAAVACHELGHALGVDHPAKDADPVASGCIAGSSADRTTPTASADDLAALYRAYAGVTAQGWGAVYSAHPHA